MPNTIRDLSELLTLFADNNSNQITAQDIRDLIVTTDAWRFSGDYYDLENAPILGTLSSQDSDDVVIEGGSLSNISSLDIQGQINSGLELSATSFSTTKMSVRSGLLNFKSVLQKEIFSVPVNYMFLIDAMEVVTTNILGVNSSLKARFGSNLDYDEYYSPTEIKSFSTGDRHLIEIPQNATMSGKSVFFGVTVASSAEIHQGFAIVHGSLIRTV
jgi:hypothetical protein